MRVYIVCSKAFYGKIPPIKDQLEASGYQVTLPNSFDNPTKEFEMKAVGAAEHAQWKGEKLREGLVKVHDSDVVLVLNFEKNGQPGYIGGATFMEIAEAWVHHKPLYFYNPVPEGMLHDELVAMTPVIINGDLSLMKETT